MDEIIKKIKTNTSLKILIGLFFIIFGFLIHLIPLVPGSWAIFIGLEILGIRLLVQNKLNGQLRNSKFFNKLFNIKNNHNK